MKGTGRVGHGSGESQPKSVISGMSYPQPDPQGTCGIQILLEFVSYKTRKLNLHAPPGRYLL